MKKEKFEKITVINPAFDKRNPDPNKNYGIHSVQIFMVLKGKKGATYFTFSTGMLLPETITEYIKDGRAKYELTDYGHYFLNKPMGYDVGYHSPTPQFENQGITKEKCEWLDNKPCYCDGSASRADEWLDILLRKGSEEIWKMLETEYQERFN